MTLARRLVLGGSMLASCVAAIAFTHPGHAPIAPPRVQYEPVGSGAPFQLFRDQRIVLAGTINGHPASMMLDSGAGMTVVDRAFAESIGLRGGQSIAVRGAGGEVPGQIATGVSLKAAGLDLEGLSVLILDMAPIERAVGRRMPVLLGREAFKAGIVAIDFPNRRISFADRSGFVAPAGAARLDLRERDRLFSIRIGVAGLDPVEADLDLGNGGTLLLARSYWTTQPSLAALRHAESQSGGVGGLVLARKVTLPDVELAGKRIANVPATLNEDPKALPTQGANVGLALIKEFRVTFDVAGGALYLEGMERPVSFSRERAGARFELAGDRLRAAYVSPDGPAAAAGLKTGDEIVAIDSNRVDAAYYDRPDWTRGPAGRKVVLERADGSRITISLADYY